MGCLALLHISQVRPGGREVQVTYIGLKVWDVSKFYHVNDAGSRPVRAEKFTSYSTAKYLIIG